MDLFAALRHPITTEAEVIHNVAPAVMYIESGAIEFLEDLQGTFADDVGKHIEPSSVSHAQDNFVDTLSARLFNGEIEQRNQAFGLRARMSSSRCTSSAQTLRRSQRPSTAQNPELLVARQLDTIPARFHPLIQPMADRRLADVHELHTDVSAIGVFEEPQDFGYRLVVRPARHER